MRCILLTDASGPVFSSCNRRFPAEDSISMQFSWPYPYAPATSTGSTTTRLSHSTTYTTGDHALPSGHHAATTSMATYSPTSVSANTPANSSSTSTFNTYLSCHLQFSHRNRDSAHFTHGSTTSRTHCSLSTTQPSHAIRYHFLVGSTTRCLATTTFFSFPTSCATRTCHHH